jgi:O-antigen ligase
MKAVKRARPRERKDYLGVIELALGGGVALLPLIVVKGSQAYALPKTVFMVAISLVLVAALASRFRRLRAIRLKRVILVVLGGYLCLLTLATAASADPAHSVWGEIRQHQGLLASACYALAFVAAAEVRPAARQRILAISVLSGTIVAAYGMAQQLGIEPIWTTPLYKGRIYASIGQANFLAAYLLLLVPIGAALALVSGGRRRWLFVAATAAIVVATVLTFSRGAYLATVIAVLTFALALLVRIRLSRAVARSRVRAAVVAVVVVTLIILTQPRTVGRVADRIASINVTESSAVFHLDLWRVGIQIALDHPFLGIGPEMYRQAFPRYRDRTFAPSRASFLSRFSMESPHNVLIAIAAGAGIPALAAYVAFLALVARSGIRQLRAIVSPNQVLLAGLLAAAAAHVVTDFFVTAEITASWVFWVWLGLIAGGERDLGELASSVGAVSRSNAAAPTSSRGRRRRRAPGP